VYRLDKRQSCWVKETKITLAEKFVCAGVDFMFAIASWQKVGQNSVGFWKNK